MISVASDSDGMNMESLEMEIKLAEESQKLGDTTTRLSSTGQFAGQYAGLVFVVPTFGNPTGATLPDVRRRQLRARPVHARPHLLLRRRLGRTGV